MSSALLGIIIVATGFLALYWIFYGQRKYNEAVLPKKDIKLKAVLFDLDGVIIDSFDSAFTIFNILRKKFGMDEFGKKKFRKEVWGGSIQDDARKYFRGIDIEKLIKMDLELIRENKDKTKLMQGAKEILRHINDKKIRIGLVTNTPRKAAIELLEYHKIKDNFDAIVAGDDAERPKPYPDSVIKLCNMLNAMPQEAMLVGDTKNDYKAGKAAGCMVVGLNTRGDLMISRLEDLKQLI